MKHTIYLLSVILLLAACGSDNQTASGDTEQQLISLKKQRAELDQQIVQLEAEARKSNPGKTTAVSIMTLQAEPFQANIEVQAQITGDEDVLATPQMQGVVTRILVRPGQKVAKGQMLATLDAAAISQQIKAMDAQLMLVKQLYEKQQNLWDQQIGTEVQLLQAKAQYESTTSQKAALVAQKEMLTIKSPISGVVDDVSIKEGDAAVPGMTGIRVVGKEKLRVTARLGENYIGKVQVGDPVLLILAGGTDSLRTKLSYVAQSVNPVSRAFTVEVKLAADSRLHPNMSCKLKIANYENPEAIAVPVSVIQRTADGDILYIAEGNKAKAISIQQGQISGGMVEILSGLKPGDKLITAGFEDLSNGTNINFE